MNDVYYSKDGMIKAESVGFYNGKTLFCVKYTEIVGKDNHVYTHCQYEYHEIKYYKWSSGLHGNAPYGTPYGYFRATRNGKRVLIR